MVKLLLFLFMVVMFISPAFAGIHTKTIGINGDAFYGNVTIDSNITTVYSTGNIEMQSTVSDYYLKFRFDEGSGTTIHDENRSHITSTFSGTPTWVAGGGLEFFGNLSNYITVSSMNGVSFPNGYTLICDLNPDDTLGRAYVHQYNGATDTDSISIDTSGGNLRGVMQKSNTYYATSYGVSGGNRYHAAFTYDNETIFLIVNGIERENDTNPSGIFTTMNTDMYIGKYSSNILPADGKIYSVSVFSRNLSISESNSLYNNEHKLFGNVSTGTTDLGSGNVFSGAGYNATIPNSSTVNIYINTSSTGITLLKSNASKDTIYLANATNKEQIYNVTYEITSTNTSETIKLENILIQWDGNAAPLITSSSPSTPTTSFVNESKTFNAGSDQLGNWTWYVDSILKKSSETDTANATYTNSTAPNGTTYNVTAIITNADGSAQTSWNWTTLQNYVTSNVTYCDGTNTTIVCIFNVSYYTPGTTQWGFNFSWTNSGQQYDWTYTNGTIIQSLTATLLNETLEFMHAPPLPTDIYYIQKSAAGTSILTIPANSWGMFNNWTGNMTFAGIEANESNDVCYTYYNVTSGLWKSYYVGYSWNNDYQLSKDTSVIGYFDAQTDITSNIITPSSTELYTGWNMIGVQSSSNQTISGIIADIGVNCSDSWYFNSSTGSYSNTTTHSIQPNQGFLAYITQNMTWTRSTM